MSALTTTAKNAVQNGATTTTALTQLRGLIEKKSNDILQILGNDKAKVQKFQSNLIRLFTTTDLQKMLSDERSWRGDAISISWFRP